MSNDQLEALYLIVNATALLLTLSALIDARADATAVRLLNGKARELAATGNVRREILRLLVLVLLLLAAVPGAVLFVLLAIPVVLLVSTIFDARDRRAMTVVVTADLLLARTTALERIEDKIDKNTEISQAASVSAKEAYNEANTVNEKIARLNEALVSQGRDRAVSHELAQRVEATVDTTAGQVDDIHEATFPETSAS